MSSSFEALPFCDSSADALELNEQFGHRLCPLTDAEMRQAEEEPQKRFQEIEPGLFLGPYSSLCNVPALRSAGITHALNLSMKRSDVARSLTEPRIELLDVEGLYDNMQAEIRPFLPRCMEFIRTAHAAGGVVLVCCQEGISRSASIVCAYLLSERAQNFPTWECALAHVKARRTCVDPNELFPPQIQQWIAATAALAMSSVAAISDSPAAPAAAGSISASASVSVG
jgi:hypothetical protein